MKNFAFFQYISTIKLGKKKTENTELIDNTTYRLPMLTVSHMHETVIH